MLCYRPVVTLEWVRLLLMKAILFAPLICLAAA